MLADLMLIASWYAVEESDRVADISKKELESEVWIAILGDVNVLAPPAEKTIDETDEGDNAEKRGDDHASDLDTEPCAVGESVDGVGGAVLIVIGDNDAAGGYGLFGLWVAHLGDGEGSWDGHDARGDESLRVQAQADICDQDGAGDGSETGAHDLVNFGHGEVRNEGSD